MITQTAAATEPAARTETTTTKPTRDDYGPRQFPKYLEIEASRFNLGRTLGFIPAPDIEGKRWSRELAESTLARLEEVNASIEAHLQEAARQATEAAAAERERLRSGDEYPVGANRAADRIAERLGIEVDRGAIEALAEAGKLQAVDSYKGWPLYGLLDLDALTAEDLAAADADRQAWLEASISPRAAADMLGWSETELANVVYERGIALGRGDRYARADIAVLADDEELAEAIESARTLGPQQAAEYLEIRPADFRYLVDGGLAKPITHVTKAVGRSSSVKVPLYRTGDLDDLKDHPGIDWEAVRAVAPGEPSPLRDILQRKADRAAVVKRFARDLARDHPGAEVWLSYFKPTQAWRLDWTQVDGAPTKADIKARVAADATMTDHADRFELGTAAGDVVRWARAMLEPGAAVILDTETTDLPGAVIEIAAIDAATGRTLLDTRVNPGPGHPIQPGAQAVHGISDADLADAPPWSQVVAKLRRITKDRQIIAYNESFDRGVILADTRAAGCQPQHLANRDRWHCAMEARTAWLDCWSWLPLNGPHGALGDCLATLAVVREMTALPDGAVPIRVVAT